jgi:hypothetical protein
LIITAATPGFLSWREGAGEQAKESQRVAEYAKVKSDISYEQVWNYMKLLDTRIASNKEDVKNLVQRIDVLIMLSKGEEIPDLPSVDRSSVCHSAGRSESDGLDDLLGLGSGGAGGSVAGSMGLGGYSGGDSSREEAACEEVPVETEKEDMVQAPIQQRMVPPEELEAMVKKQIESDRKAKQ